MNDVYVDRSGLVSLLSDRLENPTDITRVLETIEACFILQNDEGRPAYIFEIDDDINSYDLMYLDSSFKEMGICALFIPKGEIGYVATVRPDDFGKSDDIAFWRGIKTVLSKMGAKIIDTVREKEDSNVG